MKKWILIGAMVLVGTGVYAATTNHTMKSIGWGLFHYQKGNLNQNFANLGTNTYTIAQVAAQSDTNATTTATLYTPRYVGDILVGSQGSGTNSVWIGVNLTTNGWQIVEP